MDAFKTSTEGDYTFLYFSSSHGNKLSSDEISISNRTGKMFLTFPKAVSERIINEGFTHLRIRRDNFTVTHHLVFVKVACDGAIFFSKPGTTSRNIVIRNSNLVRYLWQIYVGKPDEPGIGSIRIGSDISNNDNFMTFLLTKK